MFLGDELKQVIGNAKLILDNKEKVYNMVKPIIALKDEIYDTSKNTKIWKEVKTEFMVKKQETEADLMKAIEDEFSKMKNSLDRFNMLEKFKNLDTKVVMNSKMENKVKEVIQDYKDVELKQYQDIFIQQKSDPPISKNMPPAAGKILWAELLFEKAHRP